MYDRQCALLNGPLCEYDSTTYGINYRSPLNDLPGFHDQLPQDIMHVLFEGVVPLELKLMLQEFVRKKYFNLEFLNIRIENFTYGKKEQRNKPPKDITIEGSLRLSGKLSQSCILKRAHSLCVPVTFSISNVEFLHLLATSNQRQST